MANKITSSTVSEIYKARFNILKHMEKQGFNVSGYEAFSINEVNAMYQNEQLDMLLDKEDAITKKKTFNLHKILP